MIDPPPRKGWHCLSYNFTVNKNRIKKQKDDWCPSLSLSLSLSNPPKTRLGIVSATIPQLTRIELKQKDDWSPKRKGWHCLSYNFTVNKNRIKNKKMMEPPTSLSLSLSNPPKVGYCFSYNSTVNKNRIKHKKMIDPPIFPKKLTVSATIPQLIRIELERKRWLTPSPQRKGRHCLSYNFTVNKNRIKNKKMIDPLSLKPPKKVGHCFSYNSTVNMNRIKKKKINPPLSQSNPPILPKKLTVSATIPQLTRIELETKDDLPP